MKLLSISTSYDFYVSQGGTLSEKEYKALIYSYLKYIVSLILNGYKVVLPQRMGTLSITGKKINPRFQDGKLKGLAPDWKKTNELWKDCQECKDKKQLVYHLNEHSDGYRYKFYWEKAKALISRNKHFYSFVPSRTNKRALSALIKQGKEYIKETRL